MQKSIYLTLLLTFTMSLSAHARDKSDTVWLTNGDRVTGEIRQLEHGKLRMSTDSMGTISIE
jgi:hypothetical protein